MSGPDLSDLFARAREADIESVAGVKLYRAGRRMRGECPLCGASKGKKASGAFSADVKAGVFKCWACDAKGDVIALEQLMRGGSPREAAERLAGPAAASRPSLARAAPAGAAARRPDPAPAASGLAARLWREAWPPNAAGHPGLIGPYLEGRGIGGWVLASALRRLRFHPAAFWGVDDDTGAPIAAPAMLALVVSPGPGGEPVPTGGVHVTYLRRTAEGGVAKARLDPAKKMFGPQVGADGRPGGAWLTPIAAEGPLIVAEGLESTLSAMALYGGPCRGAAALSLGRLQGGWLVDRWGRCNPEALQADPEKPAFTWPEPPDAPWGEVLIAVDRDMAPVTMSVRKPLGGTERRRIDGEARARICAGLAVQHWRRAGSNRVRSVAPPAGQDFNNALMERAG